MARVEFTAHLKTHFPELASTALEVDAPTLHALVEELERRAPGFAFYVCDELGRLRRHVNIFVDEEMLVDRKSLSDRLDESTRVFIAQALSGG